MTPQELVGKSYTFDDGSTIQVVQVVDREVNEQTLPVVTYMTQQGRSIPRKTLLTYPEFMDTYGHLFDT